MSVRIDEIRNLQDPQRTYKWRVALPPLGNFLSDYLTKKDGTELSRGLEFLERKAPKFGSVAREATSLVGGSISSDLSLARNFNPSIQVQEVQGLPYPGVEREAFYEGGRNTYFPSIEDTPPVTLIFHLDQSDRVHQYIHSWKRLITNEDGTKNLPPEYKFPISVDLLNGNNRVVFGVRLKGCFPTVTTPPSLTQESGVMTLTQEFSVDRVEYKEIDKEVLTKTNFEDRLKNKAVSVTGSNDAKFFHSFS